MLDTLYQWLVIVLPFALAVCIGLWPKRFESVGYRITVIIFGLLFSAGTYIETAHESKKAAIDKETAVQDTAAKTAAILGTQYAAYDASQKQQIAELEGYIQSQGKAVRDVKRYTAANAAQLQALWEEVQTGKQKMHNVIDEINRRIERGVVILHVCANVGPSGSGGVHLKDCIDQSDSWTYEATGLLYGSLGPLYVDRFMAAMPTPQAASSPQDPRMDQESASQLTRTVHEMQGKVNILKEFVKELSK